MNYSFIEIKRQTKYIMEHIQDSQISSSLRKRLN